MPAYYDDNFGFYEGMDDPDNQAFYRENQRKSRLVECRECGRKVKLLPSYDLCNSCADAQERGYAS